MLFDRLKALAAPEWNAYTDHAFVRALADGSLPEAAFRHYLIQDYLFLIQFARAWGLAIYKSQSLADMRHAKAMVAAILDIEMDLHIEFCRGWGIDPDIMAATPEAQACVAYTRFVLDRGLAGDLLDLHVALAPCLIGYAEIARTLKAAPGTRIAGNPYAAWIDMYAGDEYAAVAGLARDALDDLARRHGGEARLPSLGHSFRQATRLEAEFWQMGLDLAG